MNDPKPPLIDLRDVHFASGGVDILQDITLCADEHRIGVLGRNGSGKTSLARVMAGLVQPDQGQVRIGGIDVAKDRKAALGVIGILFQNPDHQIIFPTVEEELAFGLTQMGQSKQQATAQSAAMLEQFDRAHWAKASIHQLSQGQRQLVCLMAVLAMAPEVIVLDEPFAGLDIPTTRSLERAFSELDVTLVQITHDPQGVAAYDRVIWLDRGQIVADGRPAQVIASFTSRMEQLGASDDLTDLTG
ncbi:energy-coupling factor ABC transporter ATP-binding protein [Sulfitobacter sp. JB4-11]|uniref:energy-coupling factor ABC transporter ATP-binding protein n=1 Tax=Sulfitobacter rhodophyticola TaxID=3238304 RepID=UPI003511E199